jgi:hypothetical protein
MISRYKTEAMTAEELRLGGLTPLHLAIPELAALEPKPRNMLDAQNGSFLGT